MPVLAFDGLNIHGRNIKNKERLYTHCIHRQPRALVVMDELNVALDLKRLLPQTLVIFRQWGPDGDENDYLQSTPREWLESHKKYAEQGLALYVLNEPPFNRVVIEWLKDLIEINAKDYGFILVVGNWATGNPHQDRWVEAKDLLERFDQHRTLTILGLHEYAGAVVTSGLYGGYPNNAGVEPGKNGGKNLIPFENWPQDVSDVTCYHLGREKFLVQYCKSIGLKPPRIILTETGFDDTTDIEGFLKTLPVSAPYLNIRGYKTLKYQWARWWVGWSAARAYFEQIKYAVEVIWKASPVEAVCLYCWGHSSALWEQFDIEEETALHGYLEAWTTPTRVPTPVPVPPPPPIPIPIPAPVPTPPPPPPSGKGTFVLQLKLENVDANEANSIADVLGQWMTFSLQTFAVVKASGAKVELQVKPVP